MPALAEIGEKLLAAPVPGPLFQLEAEAVELLVEDALHVDVGGEDPAPLVRDVDAGEGVDVEIAAGGAAGAHPGEVLRLENDEGIGPDGAEQLADEGLLVLDVGCADRSWSRD